jgi:hypothetical protein
MERYTPRFSLLKEAFINKDVERATQLITNILGRKVGKKFSMLPDVEYFKKSKSGIMMGYSYISGDTKIRFNWNKASASHIISVDIWNKVDPQPSHTYKADITDSSPAIIAAIEQILKGNFKKVRIPLVASVQELRKNKLQEQISLSHEDIDVKITSRTVNMYLHHLLDSGQNEIPEEMTIKELEKWYKIYKEWVKNNTDKKPHKNYNGVKDNLKPLGITFIRVATVEKAETETPLLTSVEEAEADLWKKAGIEPPGEKELFSKIEYYIDRLMKDDDFNSLIVIGDPGIGKTHTIQKLLKDKYGLNHPNGYQFIKGKATGAGLIRLFWEFPDDIIFLDDCDKPLSDPEDANILKAATDDKPIRPIGGINAMLNKNFQLLKDQLNSQAIDLQELVNGNEWELIKDYADEYKIGPVRGFPFRGKVIAISNKYKDQIDAAFVSRSGFVEIDLTQEQILSRLQAIIESMDDCKASLEDRLGAFDWLTSKTLHAWEKIDFRKFKRVCNFYSVRHEQPMWESWAFEEVKKDLSAGTRRRRG